MDVAQGAEPPFFTQHFGGWDATRVSHIADVHADKLKIQQEGQSAAAAQ